MNWNQIRTIAFGILAGVVASVGTLAVTVAGFALSYDAIRAVGIASRIRVEWAWLLPVSVDGAMAVATIAAVVLRHMTGKTAMYPWAVVIVGAAISIACNGLHAIPEVGVSLHLREEVRFAVSAIPAVMLALSVHLLVTLVEAVHGLGSDAKKSDAAPDRTPAKQADPQTPTPIRTLTAVQTPRLPQTLPAAPAPESKQTTPVQTPRKAVAPTPARPAREVRRWEDVEGGLVRTVPPSDADADVMARLRQWRDDNGGQLPSINKVQEIDGKGRSRAIRLRDLLAAETPDRAAV